MQNIRGAMAWTAVAVITVLASGCSSAGNPALTDARMPGAQNYDVKIQPARIPPNPQGAFALSTATGCDVIYVARSGAPDTITYAVRPTSRVPDAADCAARLAQQPGVEAVAPAR
ncbi:MAG TPA: hypothetical protein PLE54_15390 [Burkholderiaceae bacterium]|nr:hypothetical protein [Burkholderiaceae bacterium]